jgi:hypothetical protein
MAKTFRTNGDAYIDGDIYTNNNKVYSSSNKPTKEDLGLDNVDNTADSNKSVKYATTAGSAKASDVYDWAKASTKPAYTASEVGLGNVTNDAQVKRSEMGVANGVATLDSSGLVPSSQLPSYVDDVLEYTAKSNFPTTGETGKIYVDTTTNLTYRWSGTAYVEISPSLALGETSSTAYAGNKGKQNADDITQLKTDVSTAQSTANSAVKSVTTGSTNGTIKVDGTEVTVKGLGSAAYTDSTAYATASQGERADKNTIHYIQGNTTGTNGTWTGTDTSITEYYDGLVVAFKIGITGGSSSTTLNINSLGAKTVRRNTSNLTTQLPVNTVVLLTYTTISNTGYWVWADYYYDSNTTYTNASLGQGYGTCSTAATTTAKAVALSSYVLSTGGVVSVKFTYSVPAGATLSINSKSAKSIYYRGSAITAGIINAGDIATFIYDGTQYQLIAIDRDIRANKNTIHYVASSVIITTGDSTTINWMGTDASITEYYEGLTIVFKPVSSAGTSSTTLSINGIGAKTIIRNYADNLTTSNVPTTGKLIILTYTTSLSSDGNWEWDDLGPYIEKYTFTSSSWSTSTDSADTQLGKYYVDCSVSGARVSSVHVESNVGLTTSLSDPYMPTVAFVSRQVKSDSGNFRRIYSNVKCTATVIISSFS